MVLQQKTLLNYEAKPLLICGNHDLAKFCYGKLTAMMIGYRVWLTGHCYVVAIMF